MFFLTVNILFPDGDNHPKSQKKLGPLWEGKRSAVAVVNDSPVGCQSCDRAARRRLSAKQTGECPVNRSTRPPTC